MKEIVEYFYSKRPDLLEMLLPEQIEMLEDLKDTKIKRQAISCGRGFGKTMLSSVVTLYFADEYAKKIGKPIDVLLISSQDALYDNVGWLFFYDKSLTARLKNPPSAIGGYDVPRQGFQLNDTMSRVRNCKPTVKQVTSMRADVIICDETQQIPRSIYDKALGCLKNDKVGKVIIIGTPYDDRGKGANWFIEIVNKTDKRVKWKISQYTSELCKWNDVEGWKKEWSTARFKAECQGVPPTPQEIAFFPEVHASYNIVPENPIRRGGAKSILEVGIDFGVECTVYSLIEKMGIVCNMLFVKSWSGKGIELIAPEIATLLDQHNPIIIKADSRPVEYQGKIEKHTNKKIHYIDASKKETNEQGNLMSVRQNMLGQLQNKWKNHYLIIPEMFVNTIIQLRKFKLGMYRGDDYIDSLALACYEPSTPLDVKPRGVIRFPTNIVTKQDSRFTFKPKKRRGILY